MIRHPDLGDSAFKRSRQLKMLLDRGEVQLAGNGKLKIYGTLNCSSGKRMKTDNRVFFKSEAEALSLGYRPCAHCMREGYLKWKASKIQSLPLLRIDKV
jgi:DNA/RNA endonuclease YhcR with UshA esterase domain